jgi:hypothetical protein
MRRFLRENSLSLTFGLLFLIALGFQALAGWHDFNEGQSMHHGAPIAFARYLTSSHYAAAVLENWQSEYLQFTLFILLTVWLVQRGSPESKKPGEEGGESDAEQQIGRHAPRGAPRWARAGGGLRVFLLSNSLVAVMSLIWLASWFGQSVAGLSTYNAERLDHQLPTVSWLTYLGRPDFWDRTLQNWQSELLAVGSMVILSVYLRQRGSPESKPVGAPHEATSVEG